MDYFTVQEFMRKDLNLSGNELIVYAVIYGFSKDGESKFYGSRQYLADWCGCSVRQIQTILNNLVERNLVTKYEEIRSGVKNCQYVANFTSGEIISPGGGEKTSLPREKTSPNNIINNNISTKVDNSNNKLLLNIQKPPKQKKKNLYEQCLDVIADEYPSIDNDFSEKLTEYLVLRLSMKDKPLYGVNQWKGLISKLKSLQGNPIDIVQQSITRGWATFVELENKSFNKSSSKYTGSSVFGEHRTVGSLKEEEEYGVESF